MEAKLTKVGNSVGLMIPLTVRRSMGWEAGQTILLEETEKGLLVRPMPKHRYTLENLLAKCDPNAPMPQDVKEWDGSPPTGNEVW